MARTAVVALSLALFLAVLDFGACVRCYQCNSQSDPKCKDPFPASEFQQKLVDCSSADTVNYNRNYLSTIFRDIVNDGVSGSQRMCHKIVLQTGTTIRTCLDVNPSEPNHTCQLLETTSNPLDSSHQIKSCQYCSADGCNGAASIGASLPLALLAGIISYIFYKQ